MSIIHCKAESADTMSKRNIAHEFKIKEQIEMDYKIKG